MTYGANLALSTYGGYGDTQRLPSTQSARTVYKSEQTTQIIKGLSYSPIDCIVA